MTNFILKKGPGKKISSEKKHRIVFLMVIISFTAFACMTFMHLTNEKEGVMKPAVMQTNDQPGAIIRLDDSSGKEVLQEKKDNTTTLYGNLEKRPGNLPPIAVAKAVPETLYLSTPAAIYKYDTLYAFIYDEAITQHPIEPPVTETRTDSISNWKTYNLDSPFIKKMLGIPTDKTDTTSIGKNNAHSIIYLLNREVFDTVFISKDDFEKLKQIVLKYRKK